MILNLAKRHTILVLALYTIFNVTGFLKLLDFHINRNPIFHN